MKRTESNRKVIKAITIGISAALVLMSNTTAYAGDGHSSGKHGGSGKSHGHHHHDKEDRESESTERAREASESAQEAASYAADTSSADAQAQFYNQLMTAASEINEAGGASEAAAAFSVDAAAVPGGGDVNPAADAASIIGGSDAADAAAIIGGSDVAPAADAAPAPASDAAPAPGGADVTPAADTAGSAGGSEAVLSVASSGENNVTAAGEVNKDDSATDEAITAKEATQKTKNETESANKEISDLMGSASDDMSNVEKESNDVDKAYSEADKANQKYESDAKDASDKIDAVELGLGFAEKSTENANDVIDKSMDTANGIKNAPEGTYDTEDKKAEAERILDDVLDQSNEAVKVAEQNLNTAKDALDRIEDEVKEAREAKEAAKREVDNAKAEYKDLLTKCGISFEEKDGEIVLKDGSIDNILNNTENGYMKSALTDAKTALEKAEAEAEALTTAYNKTYNENYTNAINATYAEAEKTYNELTALQGDYNTSLAEINSKKEAAGNVVKDAAATAKDRWNANRELAFSLVKSYLLENESGVVLTSITPAVKDANGNFTDVNEVTKDNKDGGFYVSYEVKDADGKTTKYTVLFNYYAFDANNKRIQKDADTVDIDHINLLKRENKTDIPISGYENNLTVADRLSGYQAKDGILQTKIDYANTAKALLDTQSKMLNGAEESVKIIENQDGSTTTKDLDEATRIRDHIEDELRKLEYVDQTSFEFKDNSDIETIQQNMDAVQVAIQKAVASNNTKSLKEECRQLAASLVVYQLRQKGYIVDDYDGNWNDKGNTNNHYGLITYKETADGELKNFYFDYVVLPEGSTDIADNILDTTHDYSKIANVQVVYKTDANNNPDTSQKGNPQFVASDGTKITFSSVDGKQVTTKYYDNMWKRAMLSDVLAQANEVVAQATSIKDTAIAYNAAKEEADKLTAKVNTAYEAVKAAAEALLKAKQKLFVSEKTLTDLEAKYAQAQADYNDAKDKLDKVKEKRDQLASLVKDAKEAVKAQRDKEEPKGKKGPVEETETGSKGHHASTTGEIGDTPGTSGTDVSAPVFMAGVTDGGIEATIDAPVVDGTGIFTGTGLAPSVGTTAPGAPAVSEATGDTEEPQSDVLGERMAPMVQAVDNGTFTRDMVLQDDGLKSASFMWWLILLVLGAKGVQMYLDKKKKSIKDRR